MNLFLLHFRGNTVIHDVSCLLGCLPELSNDNNQEKQVMRCHVMIVLNVLANTDLFAFIPTGTHACV